MKLKNCVPNEQCVIEHLRRDQEFAEIFLQKSIDCLNDPHAPKVEHEVSLLSLGRIAKAYGGLSKIAKKAGVTRKALVKAFRPGGKPTHNMLAALSETVYMFPHMTARAA
ncbi:MAG: hypothetical protein IKZ87_04710 [Actinomycetaceae bacterium]|nr:hypothetical protein [Actinomycetaceae bacterium]